MLIELNGLGFNLEVEGAGPAVLLLHGFTGSLRVWDELRAALVGTHRVIALDLIGHGSTPAPPDASRYSLDWAARDVASLLDALGLRQATVLGYSMGGRVALHFAVTHPDRVARLVMESASPGIEHALERERRVAADEALAQRILDHGIAAFVDEWERVPLLSLAPHVAPDVREAQHAQRLANTALGLANSLRGMGAGQQAPLWSRLASLALPVHLIVGESDFRYREIARRMVALLPHAQLTVIEGAGHTAHLDQPFAFARAVTAALSPADCTLS